jgi:hypothetical protein
MKMFRKTEDGAVDNLLRAHAARAAGGPTPLCREFDPDLANAFIEHSLTASERGRYEQHLSLCASCRKSVVALARMAETDTVVKSRPGIWEAEPRRWKALLGPISRPQWAMAAAAVVILAISAPLFMSRKGGGGEQKTAEALTAQAPSTAAGSQSRAGQDSPAGAATGGEVASVMVGHDNSSAQNKSEAKSTGAKQEAGESEKETAAREASGAAVGAAAKSEPPLTELVDSKKVAQNTDQTASKDVDTGQIPVTETNAPRAPEEQLAKIDPDKAKSVADQSRERAQASVLQRAKPDGEQRTETEAVVRPENDIAPPSPSNSKGRKAMAAPPGSLAIRNSRLTDPARNAGGASERKVGGRKFWLKDGTWVDKDYNPDKELPVVTVIRDSDVFKGLLSKRQGMKPFLTGFEGAPVIFIYKGTVYKLIPQEGIK